MTERGGRPHLSKPHSRDAEYLRTVHPRFDAFTRRRDRLDPGRLFGNGSLRRMLGS